MAENYGTFEEQTRIARKLIIEETSYRWKETQKHKKKTILADFSPCRYDDNEARPTPTETPQLNPFVVKSVLESNCKLFRKSGIRENFKLKPDPQMDNHFSIQWCNFTHQNNEQKEKCIQSPSLMSEQRLRTRCKICMNLQKFRWLPDCTSQRHNSVTRMVTNEQEQ